MSVPLPVGAQVKMKRFAFPLIDIEIEGPETVIIHEVMATGMVVPMALIVQACAASAVAVDSLTVKLIRQVSWGLVKASAT